MTLHLSLSPDQAATLLKLDAQLRTELEEHAFPTFSTVDLLRSELTKALDRQPGFFEVWEKSAAAAQDLCLVCPDTATRNLPWHLALLDGNRLLTLTKSAAAPARYVPGNGLPLKILVMVAAPEGATVLSHEQEELRLLRAIEPMMAKGLAQVHFTDDGSLESLERALLENRYHVLHFSGHGMYQDGVGYLLTEDEATGRPHQVNARNFNALLAKMAKRGHRPDLVVLSACQSAQGERAGDLQGVADTLLAGGTPAVIAMSASVLDPCATEFTTALYEQLARKAPLPDAFREAVFILKKYELEHPRMQALRRGREAGQWLIPQLLVSGQVGALADAGKPHQTLDFRDARYVAGLEALLTLRGIDRDKYNYVFLGRRSERRQALACLRHPGHPWVLLRGQGGVGKTSLAEHLAVRLLAADPDYKVFTHSEKAPPLESLLQKMLEYLTKEKKQLKRKLEYDQLKTWEEQFLFLVGHVEEFCRPVFIFDNVESFQSGQGGAWLPERVDVLGALQILWQFTAFPVILTGRYPIAEFPDLAVCDLNAVGFHEFRKKCWQLPFGEKLAARLAADPVREFPTKREDPENTSFDDVVHLLHRCFGGNYRALEFFDELFTEKPDDIFGTLGRLEALETRLRDTHDARSVLVRMSENLVFSELLALLTPAERETLALLARFRIPVLPQALEMQRAGRDFTRQLERLADLTLAERSRGHDGQVRFFVMPIVQDLLRDNNFPEVRFSEKMAGDYHDHVAENGGSTDPLTDLSEAFEWYYAAGAVAEINEVGYRLCKFYYDVQQFRLSLSFGLRTEEVAGEKTDSVIWAHVAPILQVFGKLDEALVYMEKGLAIERERGDRRNEGTTLNNISQIHQARGDYDTALGYLQQSLKIRQEIGDRKGEGVTLNNISLIYSAKGDYERALDYLQQSLKIQQEIGDRQGEGVTLNNISQIYDAKGDYERALEYLQQSLKIQQEIGDRKNESVTLNNLSQIAQVKGDYDTALKHSEQDLKICQEIGDINGMAITLVNIGAMLFKQDKFEEAVPLLLQAYHIFEKIGSPNVQAAAGYLNAIVEKIGEERFEEIVQA